MSVEMVTYARPAREEPPAKTIHTPAWHVQVDQASPQQWSEMLELFEDASIYQSAAYGAVRWGEQNLSRLVLKRGEEVVSIAQLRIIRPLRLRFGIAYLRWGPLWDRRGKVTDTEVPGRMVQAIEEEYLKKRKLLVRVVPNAFLDTRRASEMQAAFHNFSPERNHAANTYRTMVVDLSGTIEELRKKLDKKWRNQLTRAEKNDLNVTQGTGQADYDIFCRIYHEMRGRKSFETTVDVEEFGRIQQYLPESQRMQVIICRDKGTPAAAIVVSSIGSTASYLLGATNERGLSCKGAYLSHWTAMQWLKDRGVRSYDLGGIDPEKNPGGYHFKKGFSGADVCQMGPFYSCRSSIASALIRTAIKMQNRWQRLNQ